MSNIPLRNEQEIEKLREACKLASDVLVMIEPYVKEGVSTGELDRICHEYMVDSCLFKLSRFPKCNLYFSQ